MRATNQVSTLPGNQGILVDYLQGFLAQSHRDIDTEVWALLLKGAFIDIITRRHFGKLVLVLVRVGGARAIRLGLRFLASSGLHVTHICSLTFELPDTSIFIYYTVGTFFLQFYSKLQKDTPLILPTPEAHVHGKYTNHLWIFFNTGKKTANEEH